MSETAAPRRKTRSDGERSRAAILEAAVRLATTEGLGGLSIGRLAEEIGMSKSGLYAHFGSKEELQLAAIEEAGRIFVAEVIVPTRAEPDGLARLRAVVEAFLSYVEREVFPGGCFFESAAAEFDTSPGPVRDRLVEYLEGWRQKLGELIVRAQERKEIAAEEDAAQLAFELDAFMARANDAFVLSGDPQAVERARAAVRARLELASAGRRPLSRRSRQAPPGSRA
jgi:AcrR family transcriptional regulator